jgi:outer membrane lipoprotein LolB
VFGRYAKQVGAVAVVVVLNACANISPVQRGLYPSSSKASLYNLNEWQLEGRLAINAPNDSWSANIEWGHLPDADKIKLSGPLGQGAVAIELNQRGVKIDRGGGNVQYSIQPEDFINQQLGLSVPLRSLRFWAVGIPESGSEFQETPDGFVQNGWLIAYKEMQSMGAEIMPRKMAVSRGNVKLKLIIDQWKLNYGKINE